MRRRMVKCLSGVERVGGKWRGEVGSASSLNPPLNQYLVVIRDYLQFIYSTDHIIRL
jgi:hypothetical protein